MEKSSKVFVGMDVAVRYAVWGRSAGIGVRC